jgi:hypothetical protein
MRGSPAAGIRPALQKIGEKRGKNVAVREQSPDLSMV